MDSPAHEFSKWLKHSSPVLRAQKSIKIVYHNFTMAMIELNKFIRLKVTNLRIGLGFRIVAYCKNLNFKF